MRIWLKNKHDNFKRFLCYCEMEDPFTFEEAAAVIESAKDIETLAQISAIIKADILSYNEVELRAIYDLLEVRKALLLDMDTL